MSMTPRETPLLLSPLRFDPVRVELQLIDQLRLPGEEVWHRYTDYRAVAEAITTMVVRGAPAIGIAAAFGVVLGVRQGAPLDEVIATLRRTRPTAVNLFWALERMARVYSFEWRSRVRACATSWGRAQPSRRGAERGRRCDSSCRWPSSR